ncbi:MAG: hypothetical protein MZV64_42545 [Ignavibacteriales bacterium]|nr:hypothetical protein [Ignavibacteriales bacterium]
MVRLIPAADVAFTSRLTERAFAAAPAAPLGPQPGGRRRQHAVSGDAVEPGRPQQFPWHERRGGGGARADARAGLRPAAARGRARAGRPALDRERALGPALAPRTHLLVVGLGAIGRELAGMASGLGMRVLGARARNRRRPSRR